MGVQDKLASAADLAATAPRDPTSDERLTASQPAIPLASAVFALGWDVAELYHGDRGKAPEFGLSPGRLEAQRIEAALPILVEHLGEDALAEVRRSLVQMRDAEDGSDKQREAIRVLHLQLRFSLWAGGRTLGKAYELGEGLYDTCAGIPHSERGRDSGVYALERAFDTDRIERLRRLLDDSISAFPPHSCRAVAVSLGYWSGYGDLSRGVWQDPASDREDDTPSKQLYDTVSEELHRQGEKWRLLLSGEKNPTDTLRGGDYARVATNVEFEVSVSTTRLIWLHWRLVLVLAALVIGGVLLIVLVDNSASVVAGIISLVSGLGLTVKGAGIIAGMRQPFLEAALDEQIGRAIVIYPKPDDVDAARHALGAIPVPFSRYMGDPSH